MRLLFVECAQINPHRGGEYPFANGFQHVAINPAMIRAIVPVGYALVAGASGSETKALTRIDTGSELRLYTLKSMAELVEAWQKALDGVPSEKS